MQGLEAMAQEFLADAWRRRDGGHCQVPGCSHPGTHAHHVDLFGRAPDGLTWLLRGQPWNGRPLALA